MSEEENDDDALEAIQRESQRRHRIFVRTLKAGAIVVLVMVVVAAYARFRRLNPDDTATYVIRPPAEQAELEDERETASAALLGLDTGWRAAIDAVDPALHTTGPGCPQLASAEVRMRAHPQHVEFGSWEIGEIPLHDTESSSYSLTRTPFPVTFVGVGEPLPTMSPEVRASLAMIDGRYHPRDREPARLHSTDVLIQLVDVQRGHHASNSAVFTPSFVTARVWAFSHGRHAVVCVGVVYATNSASVEFGVTNLSDDLMTNLLRAIPSHLHAVDGRAAMSGSGHVALPAEPAGSGEGRF